MHSAASSWHRPGIRTAVLSLLAVALPWLGAPVSADQHQIFLKLTNPDGSAVTDLRPEEVTVLEDGNPRDVLEAELINWPTKLTVLVDNGPGTTSSLSQLRNGLTGLFEALPQEGMETALYTINPQPRRIVGMTTDRAEVLQGINRITPDSGAPRFFEALEEAAEREDDDDSDHHAVILVVVTDGAEGSRVSERNVQRLGERIARNAIQLHVVMVAQGAGRSLGGDQIQVELGIRLTDFTQGIYENITAGTRIESLLPELGQYIAASHQLRQSQYRLTYDRPDDAPEQVQNVSARAARSSAQGMLSINGNLQPPKP